MAPKYHNRYLLALVTKTEMCSLIEEYTNALV